MVAAAAGAASAVGAAAGAAFAGAPGVWLDAGGEALSSRQPAATMEPTEATRRIVRGRLTDAELNATVLSDGEIRCQDPADP
jgi:hypothetical protein